MQLAELVEVSEAVARARGRLEKIDRLAGLLTGAAPGEVEIVVGYLAGGPPQGRLGLGPAAIVEARDTAAAGHASLSLADTDAALDQIAGVSGPGSGRERGTLWRGLLARATSAEQDFLARLVLGELRQGALEGGLAEAVARAAHLPADSVRRAAMLAGAGLTVPHVRQPSAEEAHAFYRWALEQGHEGVMAKAPHAPYAAGSRGSAWLKVKAAHTLDLVVLAAEWGSGRRQGWLSNLHLGARDEERGGFVMLGKTFKGLTDAVLEWQTRELSAREIGRDAYTVYVRPELVVEVAFSDVQASPRYPGGLALRLARVKRYRDDKPSAEADTLAAVQAIYQRSTGLPPPPRR